MTYELVIDGFIGAEGEPAEAALGPYCVDCILNRVLHGILNPSREAAKRKPPSNKMRRQSRKQEREIMDGIGGRVQCASGAVAGYKSDGRLHNRVRMEAKFTYAKSFSIKRSDLDKIRGECEGRESPAFVVDFKDRASGRTQDRWVMIPHKEWERMINGSADDS
jgi:hypothetical protein